MTDYRDMKSDSVARLILETVKEDSKEKRGGEQGPEKRGQGHFLSEKDRDGLERRREHVAAGTGLPLLSLRKDKRRRESTEGGRTGRSP